MIYHYRIRLRGLEDVIISAFVPQLPQGFSNGAIGPPWGHGAVLWVPRAEAFTRVALP